MTEHHWASVAVQVLEQHCHNSNLQFNTSCIVIVSILQAASITKAMEKLESLLRAKNFESGVKKAVMTRRWGERGRKQEVYSNMLLQLSRLVCFLLSYFLFFSFKTYTVQDRFPRGFTR